MTGLRAALFAAVLTVPACLASAGDGLPPLPPLPSPDGRYLLSPITRLDSEGVEIWVILIADTTGSVVMSLPGPDYCSDGDLHMAWDDMGRAWIYFEPLQEIMCYAAGPDGWTMVYRNDAGKYREGFTPPDDLYPPVPGDQAADRSGSRAGDRPATLPELLIEESGPGWEYSLSCPSIPSDIAFLRDLVIEEMAAMKDGFSSNAEAGYADWGGDSDYMTWTLEASMGIPPVPEGMLAATCGWYEYSGGAHGNTANRCWLFEHDEESMTSLPWTMIGPEDLLADSAELVALSALIVDSLAESLGEFADMDWIMRGAGPEWGNYNLMLPVPDSIGALAGFSVCFPDYSVAPYVAGPREVFIPIGLLRP